MTPLSAIPPIEPAQGPVGRRTIAVSDGARDGRTLVVDVWYPAAESAAGAGGFPPLTWYEPIPGVRFESANAHDDAAVAPGEYPLIILSHGRTGMRFAYALLCEALAARGAIVGVGGLVYFAIRKEREPAGSHRDPEPSYA